MRSGLTATLGIGYAEVEPDDPLGEHVDHPEIALNATGDRDERLVAEDLAIAR